MFGKERQSNKKDINKVDMFQKDFDKVDALQNNIDKVDALQNNIDKVDALQEDIDKVNILQKGIDKIINILQNGNLHDSIYILGSKREIIKRNLMAGIFRGIGTRNRFYNNNSYYYIFFAKNSTTKYTNYRQVYK